MKKMVWVSVFSAVLSLFATAMAAEGSDQAARVEREIILVTGATGSVGKHIAADLLARGHVVRGLTDNRIAARVRMRGVEWFEGELREREDLVRALEGVDRIVYAAGVRSRTDRTNTSELVDYSAVKVLAELGQAAGIEHMVLVSSAWVTRPRPGMSAHQREVLKWKGQGEEALRGSGLDYTILRPLGMGNGPRGKLGVAVVQGDSIDASVYIEREDLALVAAECLYNDEARNKTFELFNAATFRIDGWKKDLAKLRAD